MISPVSSAALQGLVMEHGFVLKLDELDVICTADAACLRAAVSLPYRERHNILQPNNLPVH